MSVALFFFLGAAMSLAIGGFMISAGIGDIPEERSNHKGVTPTGGGLGILAALAILTLVLPKGEIYTSELAQILSLIWAVGFLGLCDDLYALSARIKFPLLCLICAAAIWVIGPVESLPDGDANLAIPIWAGAIGSFLWLFVVTNIVNFMDGSNGLMLVLMGIATAILSAVTWLLDSSQASMILLMLAAGILGLIPYNVRPKARIFTGDTGALVIGFTFAVGALWFIQEAPEARSAYLAPVLIMPFLADGLLTMLVRAMRGENLTKPHRLHLYQRLIRQGLTHMTVLLMYSCVGLVLAVYALRAVSMGFQDSIVFLLIPVAVLSLIYGLAIRRFN